MFYTKEVIQQKLEVLKEEAKNIERIIWCEDEECQLYDRFTLMQLSMHLPDVQRMIRTFTLILERLNEQEN